MSRSVLRASAPLRENKKNQIKKRILRTCYWRDGRMYFLSQRHGGTEDDTGDLIDPSDLVDAGDAAVVNTVNWVNEVIVTRQTGGL